MSWISASSCGISLSCSSSHAICTGCSFCSLLYSPCQSLRSSSISWRLLVLSFFKSLASWKFCLSWHAPWRIVKSDVPLSQKPQTPQQPWTPAYMPRMHYFLLPPPEAVCIDDPIHELGLSRCIILRNALNNVVNHDSRLYVFHLFGSICNGFLQCSTPPRKRKLFRNLGFHTWNPKLIDQLF